MWDIHSHVSTQQFLTHVWIILSLGFKSSLFLSHKQVIQAPLCSPCLWAFSFSYASYMRTTCQPRIICVGSKYTHLCPHSYCERDLDNLVSLPHITISSYITFWRYNILRELQLRPSYNIEEYHLIQKLKLMDCALVMLY